MAANNSNEQSVDPCEGCGAPVYGYIERRCCDGRECGCMGRPLEPCWCSDCWAKWEARSKAGAEALTALDRVAAIRKRTDAQRSRYGFRWNQLLCDRRDLLAAVDELTQRNHELALSVANAALRAAGCPLCMASQCMTAKDGTHG